MSRTVLIADDAVFMRRLIRDVLRPEGFIVYEAVSGTDALGVVDEVRPDLVILDLALPDMSGFEVLSRLKVRQPEPRVLLVSATVAESDAAQALIAGATGYLAKPFRPAQLLDAVRSSLGP
jgi:CheY-like chemotaxis protein